MFIGGVNKFTTIWGPTEAGYPPISVNFGPGTSRPIRFVHFIGVIKGELLIRPDILGSEECDEMQTLIDVVDEARNHEEIGAAAMVEKPGHRPVLVGVDGEVSLGAHFSTKIKVKQVQGPFVLLVKIMIPFIGLLIRHDFPIVQVNEGTGWDVTDGTDAPTTSIAHLKDFQGNRPPSLNYSIFTCRFVGCAGACLIAFVDEGLPTGNNS